MSGAGMGGADAEREGLVAEYVLGTLTAYEAGLVVRAMATDAQLAEAVEAWERWLAPLADLVVPEAPPPDLWARIESRIAPQLTTASRLRTGADAPWRMRLLGGWAFGATVVAAMLGAFILVRGEPGLAPVTTVMLSDRTQGAWTVAVERDGAIRLAAVPGLDGTTPPPPDNRAMQLWALPAGATVPTSLGLLPPGQRRITVQAPSAITPAAGMLIEITSEPPGGSPTGRPTGPVLFIGRLSQAGPDS